MSILYLFLQLRPNCDQIPKFTPVAVFQPASATYNPTGARSGIFGGCLVNGFKVRRTVK